MKLSNFIKLATLTVATVFSLGNVALPAFAQSTVLVIDQAKVLRDSDVGKHVNRQIVSIGKQMEAEMKAQVSPMAAERDNLLAELKALSVEALKSRPDLQQRAASLQQKGQKSQLEAQYKQKELQITEQKALQKINVKLEVILQAIVKEKNADVIMDRSVVIYTSEDADITETVISRINAQMKTVSVVRERLPRQPLPAKAKN